MTTIVNTLTITRILLGPVIFFLITWSNLYWLGFLLFFVAGITDFFDGYLARKHLATSKIGEILDPIADKILVLFLLFAIAMSISSNYVAFVSSVIISREIWVGALRHYNSSNSFENATKVTFLAKIKTTVQLFTISIYLLGLSLNNMLLIVTADILLLISIIITIYTGMIYTRNTFFFR